MNTAERIVNIEKTLHKIDKLSFGKYDDRPRYDQQREAESKIQDLWGMDDLSFLLTLAKRSLMVDQYRFESELYRTQFEEHQKLSNKYKAFYEYFLELYMTGLQVDNWHLNGNLKPFDEFFEAAENEMNKENG